MLILSLLLHVLQVTFIVLISCSGNLEFYITNIFVRESLKNLALLALVTF